MAAMFARLQEEIRAAGPRASDVTPAQVRLSTPRSGRAALGGLGRAAARRQGRAGQARPAAVDAVVCRAGVCRSAGVQRRRPEADRRSRRADRPARASMRIAVCRPQVPFVYGGAEVVGGPAGRRAPGHAGHEVELVMSRSPGTAAPTCSTRRSSGGSLDVNGNHAKPVELVIATKFPSYGIRHRNKVVWLVHQFRQAYDFDRTEFRQFSEAPADRATKLAVERFDRVALGEARKIFTISGNVADRLKRYSGLDATVLPPPPQKLAFRTDGYDDFVLSVNRLDRYKRIDLLIDAAKADPALQHRDRRRRPRPRPARRACLRAQRAGRVQGPRRRRPSSPTSTPAASPSTTRPSTRTTGWSPTSRSSRPSPS